VTINGRSIRNLDARGIARLILGPLGSEGVCAYKRERENLDARY
jgi:hypothetical protein